MKSIRIIKLTGLFPLAIAVGFIGESTDVAAASKVPLKSKAKATLVIRAQNEDANAVIATSALADDEIFDRDLSTVSAQMPGSNCVTAPGSNCTTVPNAIPGTMGDSLSNPNAMTNPQTAPDPNSALTDPNSVFSQPPQSQMPAPVSSLAAGQGASTAMSQVPAFMGDFFGGAMQTMQNTTLSGGFLPVGGSVAIPSTGGVGVMKLAENTSPLPRDRVFLSYNYFDNVNLIPGGTAVNRLTPGIEKTFFGGNASVEVRVPMALTLNSTTSLNGSGIPSYDTNQYQLGNVTTFFKGLLYRDETFALSTGLGVAAPTADDARVKDSSGNTVALVSNQAWHLMPFLGSVYTPNDRWFAQTMLQMDFATNGNSVYTQDFSDNLHRDGALNDPTYLFASIGTGYWLYTSSDPSARLSKISLISEFHFNTTLQHTDSVQGTQVNMGTYQSQIQTTSAVVGTNILLDQNKSLLLGYVAPIGSGSDRAFAGEFRVLFNWYFGPGTQLRATRVQF